MKVRSGTRAHPARRTSGYLVLRRLSNYIEQFVSQRGLSANSVVVDIGCGDMPYREFFPDNITYLGFDYPAAGDPKASEETPSSASNQTRTFSSAEFLPLRDDCADLVLCTQVLEHVDDPFAVVKEIERVLKRGGMVLLSTHGVFPVHPCPGDYWRWTDAGLMKLFKNFNHVQVLDCCSTIGTFAYLVEDQLSYHFSGGIHSVRGLFGLGIRWVVNFAGEAMERVPFVTWTNKRPLIGVYLVVATK